MRHPAALLCLFGLGLSGPAIAQVRPAPGSGDPRFQSVEYRADQVVLLEAAVGYQISVELAPDEQVQSIAVGDGAAWQINANRAGNRLFVKALQANAATNMTVTTNSRNYAFDLSALDAPPTTMAYTVRFRYPAPVVMTLSPASIANMPGRETTPHARYTVRGARALRPSRIIDDGVHTYIEWPKDAALPAVYVLDRTGREAVANGNMRDDAYVIDSVEDHLIFRIDRKTARADRHAARSVGHGR